MAGIDFARLGYAVDTSGLDKARASQDATTASGVRLGAAADTVSAKMSGMSATSRNASQATDQVNRSATSYNATLLAQGRALAGNNASLQQMARALAMTAGATGQAQVKASTYVAALNDLKKAHEEETAAASNAAAKMAFLGGALGSVAGIMLFQVVGAITQVVSGLASMPVEAARAQDAILRLETQLKFAFRGSSEAARQARQEINAIADVAGLPLGDVRSQYSEIAISGRSAGFTRGTATGLTRSFATLGRITGADSGRIGRALWQLQQAVAIGRLNGQDYRLMASNLPAIDDALGAGMGVDPNKIFGMVSRGEISADRMVEAIIRGVTILEQTAGGLPETMETASNRIKNEWQKLLEGLGEAMQASQFFQRIMKHAGQDVRRARVFTSGTATERAAEYEEMLLDTRVGMYSPSDRARFRDEIERLRPEVERERDKARLAAEGLYTTDANQELRRWGDAANRALGDIDPYILQRTDLRGLREQFQKGLSGAAIAGGGNPEEMRQWAAAIANIDAQLARIGPSFVRLSRELGQAEQDLATYGAAGFDRSQRARAMVEQSIREGPGAQISMPQAMGYQLRQQLLDASVGTGARGAELARMRQFLLPAAGGSASDRRRAALEFDVAQFASQFGGAANDNRVRGAVGEYRRGLEGRQAYEDEQTFAQRRRADEDRLKTMQEEMALSRMLGQERRIQLAQMERMRELQALGLEGNRAMVALEMERVAANVKIAEQLDLQRERFAALEDSARATGGLINDIFHNAISDAFRRGRVDAETALKALEAYGIRIMSNIFDVTVGNRLEKGITGWAANQIEKIPWLFGGGGKDKNGSSEAVDEMTGAAKRASAALGEGMVKSVGDAIAGTVKKTVVEETAATAAGVATAALTALTAAAEAASVALVNVAASSTGESVAELFSLAHGGVRKYAMGTVHSTPHVFRMANGYGMDGEAGAEAILPLHRGTDGKLGVRMMGAPANDAGVIVQVFDQRSGSESEAVEVRETKGPNGERQIQMFVRSVVKQDVAGGRYNEPMRAAYGVQPRIRRA